MSRSGYNDDCDGDQWSLIRWRGAVTSAIKGARGQRFFRDLVEALDAMPVKRLIRNKLENHDGEVCLFGAVARHRQIDLAVIEAPVYTNDWNERVWDLMGETFDVAQALAREAMYVNDDSFDSYMEPMSPEGRWSAVRKWAVEQLVP